MHAPEILRKSEVANRLGLTRGRVTQMTSPGGKLFEALTPDNRIDWSKARELMGIRGDVTKTRSEAERMTLLDMPVASSDRPDRDQTALEEALVEDQAFKAARRRKMEADAAAAEALLAERRGELCRKADVDAEVFGIFRDLRDKVLGAVTRMAALSMALSTERERAAMLEEELSRMFEEVAREI